MITGILDNTYLTCELDDSIPVLRHRWKKEPGGNEFKQHVQQVLGEYEKLSPAYACLAWLADTALLGELDEDTERWLVDVWEDMLFKKAGVKIHAVILGASIFADYPMEKFKLDTDTKFKAYNVHLGVFSNQEDAYQWMRQQVAAQVA